MSINYDSKIIVTDFITKDCYFTIIDGNHTFEKYLLENEQFNIHYLPFIKFLDLVTVMILAMYFII